MVIAQTTTAVPFLLYHNVPCFFFKANAMVKNDLDGDLAKPSTAIGMIVAALRQRRDTGVPSFTVLSCDNLPENGDKVSRKRRGKNLRPQRVRSTLRRC